MTQPNAHTGPEAGRTVRAVRDVLLPPAATSRIRSGSVIHRPENRPFQIIPGPVNLEGALAYRARSGRDWLDAHEAGELATLLAAYWQHEASFPERVRNAIWLTEHSARRKHDFDALITVISGLEALTNTGPSQNTKQFVQRVPDLARDVGFNGISRSMARRVYDNRSEPAQGRRLTLIPGRRGEPRPSYDQRASQAIEELALIQDALRAAVRRCIAEPDFAGHFADVATVRAKWPVLDGDGNAL